MLETKPQPLIHIGRYIDPLSDFGFKLLFGSEPNKELLISFLNELFKDRKHIVDLIYNKNENHGPQNEYRTSVYDLTCTGQDGEQFIIEVQRIHQTYFKDRAIYYTSTLIHDQGPKGENNWDFRLKEVYLIGIMDFCFDDTRPQTYLHRVHLTYEATKTVFYNKLGYIFIEIPKFKKSEKGLKNDLDRWLFVLRNMSRLEKIPVYLNKRIFEKLFKIAEVSKLSKEEYMSYERSLMAKWDEYARDKSATEKGEQRKSVEIVKNLLAAGKFTIAEIAKYAGVTEDFVRKVKEDLN
jgi:predicted transposase/invertase (TIGR01784 family)